jgi:peptidoglycan/LPS O-acetylase OafA/YrhL
VGSRAPLPDRRGVGHYGRVSVADVVPGRAAPAAAHPATDPRFALLDGVRALAAIAVVGVHVAFATGATFNSRFGDQLARLDVGVAVFFVLSGFLLYRPFVAARLDGRPGPAVGPFLRRRFTRIFPAYWVALTAVLLVRDVPLGADRLVGWYSLLHVWDPDNVLGPLGQSWTLCAEVAFYVFLPLWAAGVHRLKGDVVRTELVALAGLWAFGWVFRAWSAGQDRAGMYGSWLPGWFDHFAIGMALAVLHVRQARTGGPAPFGLDRRWTPWACWAGAAVSFWAVSEPLGLALSLDPAGYGKALTMHALYCAVAVGVLLPTLFGPARDGSGVGRVLANPVAVFLGVVSYGIYLWHQFVLDRVRAFRDLPADRFGPSPVPTFLVVLAISVVVAAASWYGFERRLNERARR